MTLLYCPKCGDIKRIPTNGTYAVCWCSKAAAHIVDDTLDWDRQTTWILECDDKQVRAAYLDTDRDKRKGKTHDGAAQRKRRGKWKGWRFTVYFRPEEGNG